MKDVRDIIIKPIITERSIAGIEENKYTFHVARGANKVEIGDAIEEIFKVKVVAVRTMNMKGKVKRRGRYSGKRPDWKKAIVTLRDGDKIEIIEGL